MKGSDRLTFILFLGFYFGMGNNNSIIHSEGEMDIIFRGKKIEAGFLFKWGFVLMGGAKGRAQLGKNYSSEPVRRKRPDPVG
ncbi:hypothetical protein [Cohnella massiliensis]|uniref:hypothetical protein n=1 Tax=Cohnella massiliensis TaxID=1816691 RepID=UPI001594A2BE|nr:hypothetical protein [Cohnella massiliensis]